MTVFKRVLIGVVALIVIGWSIYGFERQSSVGQKAGNGSNTAAARYQQANVMSARDYTRLQLLTQQTQKTGVIRNEDIRYMVLLMNAPSSYPPFLHMHGMLLFDQIKVYQPGQREAIYQAGVPLLAGKDPIDRVAGLKIVEHLGDPRAVPEVLPLLNDTDPRVSKLAAVYLNKVGYRNTPGSH